QQAAAAAICIALGFSTSSRAAVFDITLSGPGSDVTVLNDFEPSGYYYRYYHADFLLPAPITVQNGDVLNLDLDLTGVFEHQVQVVDSGRRLIYLTANLTGPSAGAGSSEAITLFNSGTTIASQSGACVGCLGLSYLDTQPASRLYITEVKGVATLTGLAEAQTVSSFQFGYALRDWLGAGPEPDPFVPAAAPEPSTWTLMIGGLGLVGSVVRRRRRTLASAA
ncbi:MAG: PEPxxWA-CTERM sorting domain-containing protein, partial [Proteobacteria bacterium]|nr:PEPxxWA-CTERM sorting domain-containing protein [Pseudomonadota bacterium]